MKIGWKKGMLKMSSNITKTVLNFQGGFGCYGVISMLKIVMRRSDGV